MDRQMCLCVLLGSFHLLRMPETVDSCSGDNTLAVIEMCETGSRREQASNFSLHVAPTGNVQRCACNLTMSGVGGVITFRTTTLSSNCGGTLTVPGGTTTDCTQTDYKHRFEPWQTCMVSFIFNSLDVSKCVVVQTVSSNITTECTGITNTKTTYSGEPVSATTRTTTTSRRASCISIRPTTTKNTTNGSESVSATSETTYTPSSPLNTKRTQLSTQTTHDTATVTPKPNAGLTVVAIAAGVGAGVLILLLLVAVAIMCYQRASRVPETTTGHVLQGSEERPVEQGNGQHVSMSSSVDNNDIVTASTDLSKHSPTHPRASRVSNTYTNDLRGSKTQARSWISGNYSTVTFESPVGPSQRSEPLACTRQKTDHHSYDYLSRTCPGSKSSADGDTCTLPPLYNDRAHQTESTDIYNHLRRASHPQQRSADYDTLASAAKFVDDMQSVYSYDRLKMVNGTSRV